MRRRILVWWFLTAIIGWGYAAFMAFMAIREGRGYLIVGAVCLGFWWLTRRAFGPVRDVWQAEAFPGRHWEMTGGSLGCLPIAIETVGLLAVLAAIIIVGNLQAEVSVIDLSGPALGFFLFLLWISANVENLFHHVRVNPYFRRRVGEIDTYCNGSHVARHLLELDGLATSLGVAPRSAFGWGDDLHGEPLVWHPSAEGLKAVHALLAHLQADEFGGNGRAGVVDDLKRIAHAIDRADRLGIDFCLLLQDGNVTSGAEHDARKGTFF